MTCSRWQIIPNPFVLHFEYLLSLVLHKWNITDLYRNYYNICSDKLTTWAFSVRTHHAAFMVAIYPHSLCVRLIKSKFNSNSFFLRTVKLWNQLPRECFSDNYKLGQSVSTNIYPTHLHNTLLLPPLLSYKLTQ